RPASASNSPRRLCAHALSRRNEYESFSSGLLRKPRSQNSMTDDNSSGESAPLAACWACSSHPLGVSMLLETIDGETSSLTGDAAIVSSANARLTCSDRSIWEPVY